MNKDFILLNSIQINLTKEEEYWVGKVELGILKQAWAQYFGRSLSIAQIFPKTCEVEIKWNGKEITASFTDFYNSHTNTQLYNMPLVVLNSIQITTIEPIIH